MTRPSGWHPARRSAFVVLHVPAGDDRAGRWRMPRGVADSECMAWHWIDLTHLDDTEEHRELIRRETPPPPGPF